MHLVGGDQSSMLESRSTQDGVFWDYNSICNPLGRTRYAHLTAAAQSSLEHKEDTTHANTHPAHPAAPWLASELSSELTTAQVSRAAAQAVRLSPPSEALYVVNSLHYSNFPEERRHELLSTRFHNSPDALESSKQLPPEPIHFGRPVSPRLAAHSFLHLLLRRGQAHEAAKYAELMMQQGIRLRTSSTQAIVESLCSTTSHSRLSRMLWPRKNPSGPPRLALELPKTLSDPAIGAAYRILQCAREFGQQRSNKMYETLISALLMQGEIIIGSLLFVLLLKEWLAYDALHRVTAQVDSEANVTSSPPIGKLTDRPPPYPPVQIRHGLLDHIDVTMARDPVSPEDEMNLQESLQALANLVSQMETGGLHSRKQALLIRTLYRCPDTDRKVWVRRDEKLTLVHAYSYFHDFLARTIHSLNASAHTPPPLLDMRSFNTLLHYSLRHRLSPSLASDVLNHICTSEGLSPNVVTINILLRSGTLLRRMDICEAALDVLRQSSDMRSLLDLGFKAVSVPAPPVTSTSAFKGRGNIGRQQRHEQFVPPSQLQLIPNLLQTDLYTLVAYLQHLTSTGNPRLAVDLVFRMFPEMNIEDQPAHEDGASDASKLLRARLHEACLRRAVRLGPHVFAALLNALVKAGRTGLAERVWLLAQEAERASWTAGFMTDVKPWCLSIHAYTSMIQCYSNEATRSDRPLGANATGPGTAVSGPWLRGWARPIYTKREALSSRATRHKAGGEMAILVFRTALNGVQQVIGSMLQMQEDTSNLPDLRDCLPVPDERFFNAILSLFRLDRPLRGRTECVHRQFLQWSIRTFAKTGKVSQRWTPLLNTIGQAIVDCGYAIPIGYRHLFTGRWPRGTWSFEAPKLLERRPFAFHRGSTRRIFRPYTLPTVKTRGLPVRKGRRRYRSKSSSIDG